MQRNLAFPSVTELPTVGSSGTPDETADRDEVRSSTRSKSLNIRSTGSQSSTSESIGWSVLLVETARVSFFILRLEGREVFLGLSRWV
jgi:hypothetical protein